MSEISAKILVLGDSGVGKTSLIHLICRGSVLSSSQWTIGCSIDVKLYDDCFLEFHDIAGSRAHKIARSFLYDDYQGVMLVFDATNKKSRTNLDDWLAEATESRNHERRVPIINVGTKIDLLSQDTDKSGTPANSSVIDFDNDAELYVNTRDVHSLSQDSTNYRKLEKFFKRIINRLR